MAALSDSIEQFINDMLDEFGDSVELRRNDMADYFRCAPSQITYVLATRFSPERGYVTESRRGGGGYIKVLKIKVDGCQRLMELIGKLSEGAIGEKDAFSVLCGLEKTGTIGKCEYNIMKAAVSDKAIGVPVMKDAVRANVMKEMLIALLNGREEQ